MSQETCARCGESYGIGEWPWCPHGAVVKYRNFQPYFDHQLGRQIDSLADRWNAQKALNIEEGGSGGGATLSPKTLRDARELARRRFEFDSRSEDERMIERDVDEAVGETLRDFLS